MTQPNYCIDDHDNILLISQQQHHRSGSGSCDATNRTGTRDNFDFDHFHATIDSLRQPLPSLVLTIRNLESPSMEWLYDRFIKNALFSHLHNVKCNTMSTSCCINRPKRKDNLSRCLNALGLIARFAVETADYQETFLMQHSQFAEYWEANDTLYADNEKQCLNARHAIRLLSTWIRDGGTTLSASFDGSDITPPVQNECGDGGGCGGGDEDDDVDDDRDRDGSNVTASVFIRQQLKAWWARPSLFPNLTSRDSTGLLAIGLYTIYNIMLRCEHYSGSKSNYHTTTTSAVESVTVYRAPALVCEAFIRENPQCSQEDLQTFVHTVMALLYPVVQPIGHARHQLWTPSGTWIETNAQHFASMARSTISALSQLKCPSNDHSATQNPEHSSMSGHSKGLQTATSTLPNAAQTMSTVTAPGSKSSKSSKKESRTIPFAAITTDSVVVLTRPLFRLSLTATQIFHDSESHWKGLACLVKPIPRGMVVTNDGVLYSLATKCVIVPNIYDIYSDGHMCLGTSAKKLQEAVTLAPDAWKLFTYLLRHCSDNPPKGLEWKEVKQVLDSLELKSMGGNGTEQVPTRATTTISASNTLPSLANSSSRIRTRQCQLTEDSKIFFKVLVRGFYYLWQILREPARGNSNQADRANSAATAATDGWRQGGGGGGRGGGGGGAEEKEDQEEEEDEAEEGEEAAAAATTSFPPVFISTPNARPSDRSSSHSVSTPSLKLASRVSSDRIKFVVGKLNSIIFLRKSKCIWILYSKCANSSKTTFLNVLREIFGQRYIAINASNLAQSGDAKRPDLISLNHRYMYGVDELPTTFSCQVDKSKQMDNDILRQITGGMQTGGYRELYANNCTAPIHFVGSLVIACNELPCFKTDRALNQRLCFTRFKNTFSDEMLYSTLCHRDRSSTMLTNVDTLALDDKVKLFIAPALLAFTLAQYYSPPPVENCNQGLQGVYPQAIPSTAASTATSTALFPPSRHKRRRIAAASAAAVAEYGPDHKDCFPFYQHLLSDCAVDGFRRANVAKLLFVDREHETAGPGISLKLMRQLIAKFFIQCPDDDDDCKDLLTKLKVIGRYNIITKTFDGIVNRTGGQF